MNRREGWELTSGKSVRDSSEHTHIRMRYHVSEIAHAHTVTHMQTS